jgi:hypothetical protein
MIIANIQEILEDLRQHEDLRKFQEEDGKKFCKKHKITSGQLNFLLSVVAAERIKEKGIS